MNDATSLAEEYRANPIVNLHVVTDWQGSSAEGSEWREQSLKVFDLLEAIHIFEHHSKTVRMVFYFRSRR